MLQRLLLWLPGFHPSLTYRCAEPVLERLRAWAATRPGVVVVEGTWQATLPDLGEYDAIFFDDFGAPGLSEHEMMAGCC